jgi:hypothetical protein
LAMVLLWNGAPTADVEVAPVHQYAKMVWRAATRREESQMRSSALPDIRAMWEAASRDFTPLADRMLAARREDGTIPPAVARATWARVRGPIAAAAVSLARIGWTFASPFVLRDAMGDEHELTTNSPQMIRDLLRDATRDDLERKVGAKFAASEEAFRGRRACLDLAIQNSRPSKSRTPQQCGAFKSVACGALWTAMKAKERGYATDGLCPLCHREPDTPRHRVYGCEATRDAVISAVPRWFWDEATRTGAHGQFWTTAVFPHPADHAPRPRADLHCEVEHHTAQGRADADDQNRGHVTGRVCVDGSCTPSPIRGLGRAAMALVMQDGEGEPVKTLQLAVPRHLPQTAQAAENLIIAVAFRSIRGAAEVIGDCLNVVRAYTAAAVKALRPTNKYAGIVLDSFRDVEKRRSTTVRWTRAHRTLTGSESQAEQMDIRGNALADKAAKDAIRLHPPSRGRHRQQRPILRATGAARCRSGGCGHAAFPPRRHRHAAPT